MGHQIFKMSKEPVHFGKFNHLCFAMFAWNLFKIFPFPTMTWILWCSPGVYNTPVPTSAGEVTTMTTKPLCISSSSYNIKIYNARSAWNVGFIYATTEDSFNLIILMEMHFLTTGPFILLWACCWRMKIIFIFQNIVNTTTSDLSFSRL